MPNLNALKDKLTGLKAQLWEKADKIGFIRKWREKTASAGATGKKNSYASPHSLRVIYRDGSTGTRFQVLAFYVFVLVALVSTGSLLRKVSVKFRSSAANEQLKQDYTNEFAEAQRKVQENAELLSLGQFTANIYVNPPAGSMIMKIDLWIRVNEPDAAAEINSSNELFRDKTVDALSMLFAEKVSLLTEAGKAAAREKIKMSLNSALKKGAVVEVYIENLIAQ